MNDNQIVNTGNTKIINKYFYLIKPSLFIIISLALSLGIGVGFTILMQDFPNLLIVTPLNIITVWLVSFLLVFILKANYQKPLFVFDMIVASFLVSFYPFDQAFISVLVLILIQKVIKLI